jgi:hypothetical protein
MDALLLVSVSINGPCWAAVVAAIVWLLRSAKSKLRALQEQGIPAAKAAKIAAAQAAGMTGGAS